MAVMGRSGLLVVRVAASGALTPTPVNPFSSSPSASALLDTAPPPTPRSRSEISGASRRWPRETAAAGSRLTTRFVRTEASSAHSKCRVDLLLHLQLSERCTGRRDTGGAGVRMRRVPGLGCPARREDLGSTTRRMASRHPGGESHVLDRLHRGRGGHRCRGVEDGGPLLGRGPAQSVPDPQAWAFQARPRRGGRRLAENQSPPGYSD